MTEEENAARDGAAKPSNWLTTEQAAAMQGLTVPTLNSYRSPSKRRGPPFHKHGFHVVYLRDEVEAYIAETGRRALKIGG